ncbi:MAG TPA: SMC-Scp complex subunit ScpB [Thermomicrobiales bacterium]|nr:SMC-Scp complex subunit ScpB [Thermomicrobiales bacterium]
MTDPAAPAAPAALPGLGDADLPLPALCEALLFVAAAPTPLDDLARALDAPRAAVEAALAALAGQLAGRGLQLQRHGDRYALVSAPGAARAAARFLGLSRVEHLSPAALETLAIVAYRGPVTRGEVEALRGVDSSGVLHTLAARALIESVGRRATVGTPIEYAVTPAFLRHFGLASLDDLPPLGEVDGRPVATLWDERQRAADAPDRAG